MIRTRLLTFASPPKTGCVWTAAALSAVGLKPMDWHGPHDPHTPCQLDDLPSVTTRRDPVRWLASWYRYSARRFHHPGIPEYSEMNETLDHHSLRSFARSYLKQMPGTISRIFDRYRSDYTMCLECQPRDLIRILRMVGLKFDPEILRSLRPLNVSKRYNGIDPFLAARIQRVG